MYVCPIAAPKKKEHFNLLKLSQVKPHLYLEWTEYTATNLH